ncbi:MAG TPA: nitroreductase family protein [Spirochaetales bacterium]|nr:nitroreductase family protein [Spirochaetales bacterium]
MDMIEAMAARHSVRSYTDAPIEGAVLEALTASIAEVNRASGLAVELSLDGGKAFANLLGRYGKFEGVRGLFVIKGRKSKDLGLRAGYWGERLVLEATALGLGTCWVGGTYSKRGVAVGPGEELVCVVTVGYAAAPGRPHRTKTIEAFVPGGIAGKPAWFVSGVEAAMLAPTALNQQKFSFALDGNVVDARVSGLGVLTDIDLGIARLHFELGAGAENFAWTDDTAG